MPTVDCHHETVGGVTLVACTLSSDVSQRVTIEPTHAGPIWPPRRQGVPAAGWDDDGWTGLVPADGRRALGYATSATPGEEPVRIAATEHPDDADESVTARDVIRSLGDPTPARDAVPTPDHETTDAGDDSSVVDPTSDGPDSTAAEPEPAAAEPEPITAAPDSTDEAPTTTVGDPDAAPIDLDAVETRLWTARDLAAVSSVPEARDAVDRAGGLEAVRDLAERLETDRRRLRERQDRTDRLLAEAEAVEVPVDSLERLV